MIHLYLTTVLHIQDHLLLFRLLFCLPDSLLDRHLRSASVRQMLALLPSLVDISDLLVRQVGYMTPSDRFARLIRAKGTYAT